MKQPDVFIVDVLDSPAFMCSECHRPWRVDFDASTRPNKIFWGRCLQYYRTFKPGVGCHGHRISTNILEIGTL